MMMDCSQARALFSEHQDLRLPAGERAGLERHLESCAPCGSEWTLYHRVFDQVAMFSEIPAERPFRAPAEAPGALDRTGWSEGRWGRVRVAAAVLVLLGISHVAVFEWARSHPPTSPEFRPLDKPLAAMGNGPRAPLVNVNHIPSRVRDLADTASIVTRQLAQMPEGAHEEGIHLVRTGLDLLNSSQVELEQEMAQAGDRFQSFQAPMRGFQRSLKQFNDQAVAHLSDPTPHGHRLARVQRALERSRLSEAITPLMLLPSVASAARGTTWRQAERMRRLKEIRASTQLRADVKSFLSAQSNLLTGDYATAARAFEGFRRVHPRSKLTPLSCYMQAECYREMGLYTRAWHTMVQPQARIQFRVKVRDPLLSVFTVFGGQVTTFRISPGLVPHMAVPGGFTLIPATGAHSDAASVPAQPREPFEGETGPFRRR